MLQKLLAERGKLWAQMKTFNDGIEARDGTYTTEESAKWATMNAALDKLDQRVARAQQIDSRDADLSRVLPSVTGVDANTEPTDAYAAAADLIREAMPVPPAAMIQRNLAIAGWLIGSQNPGGVTPEMSTAMEAEGITPQTKELTLRVGPAVVGVGGHDLFAQNVVGTDNLGGFSVPEGQMQPLERAQALWGAQRAASFILRAGEASRVIPWPTSNDTPNEAVIVAEAGDILEQTIPFGQIPLAGHKLSSKKVPVSWELLSSSASLTQQVIFAIISERLARGQNRYVTEGTDYSPGTTFTAGVLDAPSAFTAVGTTSLTADELLDLAGDVEPAYAQSPSARYVFNNATLHAVRKLKDSSGRYYFALDGRDGFPGQIFGYQYVVNQAMPDIALSAKPVAFGDLSKLIYREGTTVRLRVSEHVAFGTDVITFVGLWGGLDSAILDAGTEPIKLLTMAAA